MAENHKVTVAEVPSVSVHTLTDLGQRRTFMGEDVSRTFQGLRGKAAAPMTGRRVPKRRDERHWLQLAFSSLSL